MNIYDINKETIKSISNKELISLHYRIHQLYGNYKSKKSPKINELKKILKNAHKLIIKEMEYRNLHHRSVIKSYLKKINKD